jgi:HEAT repeat protein
MRLRTGLLLALGLLAFAGCRKEKSTDEMISDLKSQQATDRDRTIAIRTLPQRKGDAARVIPALTEALTDKDGEIRRSAAIGLGYFGDQAKDAVPLLEAAQHDKDIRVREAATVALSRIDPAHFPDPYKQAPAK